MRSSMDSVNLNSQIFAQVYQIYHPQYMGFYATVQKASHTTFT